jgi:hypothetical protein
MTTTAARSFRLVLSGLAGLGFLLASDNVSFERPFPGITSAQARIGRPLTPMSYAGVARRTTRRAVGVGVATGVAVGVAAGAAASCVQAVNAYGQIVYQCP